MPSSPSSAPLAAQPPRAVDDSTRYLVAAAHLDREYAEAAVGECLAEPTRQVAPSPGIHAATVLTEALAARTRRKYRDGLLAVLGAVFVWCGLMTGLLAGWLAVAFVVCAVRIWRRNRAGSSRTMLVAVLKIVGIALVSLALAWVNFLSFSVTALLGLSSSRYRYSDYDVDGSGLGVYWAVGVGCAVAMLVILVADRFVVWHHLTAHFGRAARIPGRTAEPSADRVSLTLAPPRFRAELQRQQYGRFASGPDAHTPVIVHRGTNPFVGAGESVKPWSMVLPLTVESDDDEERPELTARLLYQRIAERLAELRESGPLSPDRRLHQLSVEGRVFVPADKLLDHLHLNEARAYLPREDMAPECFLHDVEAGQVLDQAREWSRYYLCAELETWDRDLVVSAFLHCAVGANELYLEWTPCVLPPIAAEYRVLDKMVNNGLRPIGEGLRRWLLLPVTSFGRIANAFRMRLPLPHDPNQLNPDRYGAGRTLRELAAMRQPRNYFQTVDAERYVRLLESRLVPAVVDTLAECGYSSTVFERRAEAVTTNNITISGTNNAPMVFGGESHGDITGPGKEKK